MATPVPVAQPVGRLLREWRRRRRLSQMDLALEAAVSTRHVSFIETGRATPSREMLMHLAESLEVPLRERNTLLLAAGYAPAFRERPLQDAALAGARRAVDLVLAAHEPWPALAVDRHWNLVAANRTVAPLLSGADAALLQPPVNVLRLSLHPGGLSTRIENLAEWRAHVLARLRRQVDVATDAVLAELLAELKAYPGGASPADGGAAPPGDLGGVIVPLRYRTEAGVLSFFSTTTVFGTPVEITLAELALETFFPADEQTGQVLRRLAAAAGASA